MPNDPAKALPDPDLEGQVLDDRYEVYERLGSGALGVVYRCYDRETQQNVAVKVLRELSGAPEATSRRFAREIHVLSELRHPHIVAILGSEGSTAVPYYVMELLQGETLAEALRGETPLAWPRARRVFSQLLDALACVHSRGVLHRDLKPANVFLQRVDGEEQVKLIDFGMVKLVDGTLSEGADEATLTRTGQLLGTPGYMPPEQFLGQPAEVRSDVYSATLILFEMLAGVRPFSGNFADVAKKQISGRIPPLRELRPGIRVAPELTALFAKGMAPEVDARYASIDELREAFEALPDPPVAQFWRSLGHARSEGASESLPVPGHDADAAPERRVAGRKLRSRGAAARWLGLFAAVTLVGFSLAWPRLRSWSGAASEPEAVEAAGGPDQGPRPSPEADGAQASHAPPSRPATEDPVSEAPSAPPAPWRAPPHDPWSDPIPSDLATIRQQLEDGARGDDAMIAALRRHNSDYPTDPRGHLLLARLYFNRHSPVDMVNQYEFAVLRQPSARGDAHMLDDLLSLHHSSAWNEASDLIVETYGDEAEEPVARLLRTNLAPESRRRLQQLLERI